MSSHFCLTSLIITFFTLKYVNHFCACCCNAWIFDSIIFFFFCHHLVHIINNFVPTTYIEDINFLCTLLHITRVFVVCHLLSHPSIMWPLNKYSCCCHKKKQKKNRKIVIHFCTCNFYCITIILISNTVMRQSLNLDFVFFSIELN